MRIGRWGITAAVVALLGLAWWARLQDPALDAPAEGFSPGTYAGPVAMPAAFDRDFPGGAEAFHASAFMRLYPAAYRLLGIAPESLRVAVIGLELAALAAMVACLFRVLAPGAGPAAAGVAVVLVVAGRVGGMDPAGHPVGEVSGLHDTVADALWMFAAACLLTRRPRSALVLLAGCVLVHPVKGLGAAAVAAVLGAPPPSQWTARGIARVALLFAAPVAAWLAAAGGWALGGTGDGWVEGARAVDAHLFPIEHGVFTTSHDAHVLPLLSFLSLAALYVGRGAVDPSVRRRVTAALLAAGALTLAGAAIATGGGGPLLIRLSLHRAGGLLVLLALPAVVGGLWSELESPALLRRAGAACLLLSPLLMRPGFPLAGALFLIVPAAVRERRAGGLLPSTAAAGGIAAAGVALVAVCAAAGWGRPWTCDAYTGGWTMATLAACAGAGVGALAVLGRDAGGRLTSGAAAAAVIVAGAAALAGRADPVAVERAQSYREVQAWARDHAPSDALVMVDPAADPGWRTLSAHASFGNLREWLMPGRPREGVPDPQRAGRERIAEFGIDAGLPLRLRPPPEGFVEAARRLQSAYYDADDGWRTRLSLKYGVRYYVMDRSRARAGGELRVVFENRHYKVLESDAGRRVRRVVYASDFPAVASAPSGRWGWGTYSEGRPVSWPWGIRMPPGGDRPALCIDQPDAKDYWLHTGDGPITAPPADAPEHTLSGPGPAVLRISARMAGAGSADLYLWHYGPEGRADSLHLGHVPLAEEEAWVVRFCTLPAGNRRFRAAFLLREKAQPLSSLRLREVRIEEMAPDEGDRVR